MNWRDLFQWQLAALAGATLANGDHELRITLRRRQ